METKVIVEKKGHVLMMGLNRPAKLNAFDIDMFVELAIAFGRLNDDPECRCGLLYANGKHFTAGLDLSQWAPVLEETGLFPPLPAGALDPRGLDPATRVKKPVVIAVHGVCFTIGFELLLAMDVRVAARDTRFALLEVKRGIYPTSGGTVRLHREIGWGNAMRYLLSGDELPAEEAWRLGLVQEVVETGQQPDQAFKIAETISKQAPLGVRAALLSARLVQQDSEKPAIDRLAPDLVPVLKSEDAAEGVKSFVERREARFQGR